MRNSKDEGGFNKSLIFVHIPKTAGSTINSIFDRQYKGAPIFTTDASNIHTSINKFREFPASQRRAFRMIRGHMGFGVHEFLSGPCTYFTMLRNPIDRVISHYSYVLRTPDDPYHDAAKYLGLQEYNCYVQDNWQTRYLSGFEPVGLGHFGEEECTTAVLENAKRNLVQYFDLVGIVERFDETVTLLRRKFAWTLPFYIKRNVTRTRLPKEKYPVQTIAVIEKYNKFDMELYNFGLDLFDKQIGLEGQLFTAELQMFKLLNTLFTLLSQIKIFIKKTI